MERARLVAAASSPAFNSIAITADKFWAGAGCGATHGSSYASVVVPAGRGRLVMRHSVRALRRCFNTRVDLRLIRTSVNRAAAVFAVASSGVHERCNAGAARPTALVVCAGALAVSPTAAVCPCYARLPLRPQSASGKLGRPWGRAMRFRSAFLLILFVSLIVCLSIAAHAEKRVALVIGNAAYKNAPTLQNPKNDAADVADALKHLGFETIVGLDLDKAGMEDATIKFARDARDVDVALVYYSGHAMQRRGVNYLMPVDAALHDDADLRRLTRVDEIVDDLSQAKSLRILVLDACRVNPMADELSRTMELTRGSPVDRGIARMTAPNGMIISFATQPNQTAADGQGRNSPYTMAFLKNIEAPEEIGIVFHHMRADVYNETQGKQLPELSLSYIGEFYLKGRPKSDGTLPQVAVVAPPANPTAPAVSSGPCASAAVTASPSSRFPPGSLGALFALAQPLSASKECALKPKDVFKECENCPEMVVIPPGSFTMGSPSNEKGRSDDEGPQHTVTISHAFAIGKFTVTVDQFADFVKETGYNTGSGCFFSLLSGESGDSFRNPGFSRRGRIRLSV